MSHHATIPIDTYQLSISRNSTAFFNPPQGAYQVRWQAQIICRGANEEGSWQMFLFFTSETEPPANSRSLTKWGHRTFLFLPREAYEDCVDMLRNENPVFLVWSDKTPATARLTTALEAVGEGEGVGAGDQQVTVTPPVAARSYAPFQENTMSHSLVNGYLLGIASRDVYGGGGPASTGSVFREWFETRYTPWMTLAGGVAPLFDMISDAWLLGGTGVQAMVMSNERFVIVVFRGTQIFSDDPGDWLTNVAFAGAPAPAVWAPGVFIHNGWLAAVNKVYPDLVNAIRRHMGTGKRLWICGHSLGGALSVITALRLQTTGDAVVQGVATFGAPPAGSGLLAHAYNVQDLQRRTRRWVNNRDIGPQLPLPGYQVVGTETFIDSAGVITPDAPWSLPTVPSFADHSMPTYCNRIRAALDPGLAGLVPL